MDLESILGRAVEMTSQGGYVESEFRELFDVRQARSGGDRNEGQIGWAERRGDIYPESAYSIHVVGFRRLKAYLERLGMWDHQISNGSPYH